jgi:hypothetical protein
MGLIARAAAPAMILQEMQAVPQCVRIGAVKEPLQSMHD